jgi:hypothetical protein
MPLKLPIGELLATVALAALLLRSRVTHSGSITDWC